MPISARVGAFEKLGQRPGPAATSVKLVQAGSSGWLPWVHAGCSDLAAEYSTVAAAGSQVSSVLSGAQRNDVGQIPYSPDAGTGAAS
jgi:hypothetical protein